MFGLDCFAKKFPVDLVILWVDGSDPAFMNERACWARKENCENAASNHVARFVQNDELRYVLRSVEKNLIWISRVVLVTNGQVPPWLNTQHPHLKLLFHDEFMPKKALPTFNSCAIEAALPLWKGLTEHFLLANDDMFIWRPVSRSFFFPRYGQITNWRNFSKTPLRYNASLYRRQLHHTYQLIQTRFCPSTQPKQFMHFEPHHNIDGYLKTMCNKSWEIYSQALQDTVYSRFRRADNVSRWLFAEISVLLGKGQWKTSYKHHFWGSSSCVWELGQNYERGVYRFRPKLVCLNDSESSTEQDRKRLRNFLERAFPEKSSFEK